MRGGISIALALGVPDSFVKHAVPGHMTFGQLIFFMTFILVVFSIVVQGLLFEPVIRMINRISYEIMPSGGLGTYVSTISLGNGFNNYADSESHTPDNSITAGGERLWDGTVYGDFDADAPTAQTPLISSIVKDQNYLFKDELRPTQSAASDIGGIRRTESNVEGFRRPPTIPSHTPVEHERQGSVTFQNMPALEAIPSIPTFLGDLHRRSSTSFQRWFDPKGRLKDNEDSSAPLRRSQTEPDNARLARGEQSANLGGSSSRQLQPPRR